MEYPDPSPPCIPTVLSQNRLQEATCRSSAFKLVWDGPSWPETVSEHSPLTHTQLTPSSWLSPLSFCTLPTVLPVIQFSPPPSLLWIAPSQPWGTKPNHLPFARVPGHPSWAHSMTGTQSPVLAAHWSVSSTPAATGVCFVANMSPVSRMGPGR